MTQSGAPREGGYSDIFIFSSHFWGVQNFEFQYVSFFLNEYFMGMKIFWIFFGVITKIGHITVSFLCILGSFLKDKVQNGGYFLGC